ncbi:hypothetical protein HLB23_08005 [Nocardia uniformis]|uniref:Uncharacterized protein n=1 Tax=Nocardia uniformis TaxID=53432 RepID=A0A849C4B6_9NOCA|nr:hypothetical protein [Nocardia uniformis]NNH69809.1 hypothetical protein [Nocardia uniformis]
MRRAVRVATVAASLSLTALVAGCGVNGTALPGEIDVRALNTGAYPIDRHSYDQRADGDGALLEGFRMAEAVVPTSEIDPSLSIGRGGIVLPDPRTVVSVSNLSGASRPVLENRGFITGYAASGSDLPDKGNTTDPASTAITVRLLRFPDADAAKLAARELEDADFNVALDQNKKLTIAEYPDAFAHWRPGVPSIGMTMPRKEFVISVFASRPRADEKDLVSWAKKTLDAEVPVVDAFQPTPADKLDELPVDPDGLLARTLVDDRDNRTPDPDTFAVYGPNSLVLVAADQAKRQQLIDEVGMDAMSTGDDNFLFRVRDADGGAKLVNGLIDALGERWVSSPAPENVPGTKCARLNRAGDADNAYRCYVVYKRYVGLVNADSEREAQLKASAQYALLANSL